MERPMIFRRINGKRCERLPMDYPYSYSAFCLYKNEWKPTDEAEYTDRLAGSYENYDRIKEECLGRGDYFSSYETKDIEKFLQKLLNKDVILTGVEEECNYSSGYPYWILYFRQREDAYEKVC